MEYNIRKGGDMMYKTDYTGDIRSAERARNNQKEDCNPSVEMEGYLGVDDLDKLRRLKLKLPLDI